MASKTQIMRVVAVWYLSISLFTKGFTVIHSLITSHSCLLAAMPEYGSLQKWNCTSSNSHLSCAVIDAGGLYSKFGSWAIPTPYTWHVCGSGMESNTCLRWGVKTIPEVTLEWTAWTGTGSAMYRDASVTDGNQMTQCPRLREVEMMSCDLETDFCGMAHRPDDTVNWIRLSGTTSSGGTGPNAAHSGAYYMYFEVSGPLAAGSTAKIDVYTFPHGGYACVRLMYNMNGGDSGDLEVDLYDGTTLVQTGFRTSGDQGIEWHSAEADFFVPTAGNKIVCTARATGTGYFGDTAVDQISVFPNKCH